MTNKELYLQAVKAMENSYSPYSGCKVGAALLTASGKVFIGTNIENAAFSPTVCAERVAVFKAISEGEKNFLKIAVAGGKNGEVNGIFAPCGVCRQALAEFCDVFCEEGVFSIEEGELILEETPKEESVTEKEDTVDSSEVDVTE